jgi:hypothetical protein
MDRWLLGVIILIILASIFILFLKRDNRKEKERLEYGDLKAEDFEIIEG